MKGKLVNILINANSKFAKLEMSGGVMGAKKSQVENSCCPLGNTSYRLMKMISGSFNALAMGVLVFFCCCFFFTQKTEK